MTHRNLKIFSVILTTFLLLSCGQNSTNNVNQQDKSNTTTYDTTKIADTKKIEPQTAEPKVDTAYLNLVKFVDKEFSQNLKDIDKDFGENNFSRFTKILKKHKTTVYDLYLELSEIKKNAVSVARANGVEIRADGKERILNTYYYYLKKEITSGKNNFQSKYGFDNRLLQCFENNYCFCYEWKEAVYCNGGDCKLINGEFWKHN